MIPHSGLATGGEGLTGTAGHSRRPSNMMKKSMMMCMDPTCNTCPPEMHALRNRKLMAQMEESEHEERLARAAGGGGGGGGGGGAAGGAGMRRRTGFKSPEGVGGVAAPESSSKDSGAWEEMELPPAIHSFDFEDEEESEEGEYDEEAGPRKRTIIRFFGFTCFVFTSGVSERARTDLRPKSGNMSSVAPWRAQGSREVGSKEPGNVYSRGQEGLPN